MSFQDESIAHYVSVLMEPTTLVLKVRLESFLVEKLYHLEELLKQTEYPAYEWISHHFIGKNRPKFMFVVEKLKSLQWKMTHQVTTPKYWLITMEINKSIC